MAEKSPERLDLDARATGLGIKVPVNIGDKKLVARIEAREAEIAAQDNPPIVGSKEGTENGSGPQPGAKVAPGDKKPTVSDLTGGAAPGTVDALVLDHLEHDGEIYQPDETVLLPTADFLALKSLGVVAESISD